MPRRAPHAVYGSRPNAPYKSYAAVRRSMSRSIGFVKKRLLRGETTLTNLQMCCRFFKRRFTIALAVALFKRIGKNIRNLYYLYEN